MADDGFTIIEPVAGELQPCPFCGSDPAFEQNEAGYNPTWHVYCRDRAEGCPIGMINTIGFARRGEAAASWNKRRST